MKTWNLQVIGRRRASKVTVNCNEIEFPLAQTIAAEILDQIFGYLPKPDLRTCTVVCRWWGARSSPYLLRRVSVLSKTKLFFLRTGLQHFRAAATSSSRLVCSVRELCLQGTLELLALQGTVRELQCLRTLELRKTRFASGKKPRIAAASRTHLQILKFSHIDPPQTEASSHSTSSWNVLSLFSSIGMLCIAGSYVGEPDNLGFLKDIAFNARKTRIHALSMKGDLLPFADSALGLAMDFRPLKRLNVVSLSILDHTTALAGFLTSHNSQLAGLYLQTTLGVYIPDMDLATQVSQEAKLLEQLSSALASCASLRSCKINCFITVSTLRAAPMALSWNNLTKNCLRADPSLTNIQLKFCCYETRMQSEPSVPFAAVTDFFAGLDWTLIEAGTADDELELADRRVQIKIKAQNMEEYMMRHCGFPVIPRLRVSSHFEALIRSKVAPGTQKTLVFV